MSTDIHTFLVSDSMMVYVGGGVGVAVKYDGVCGGRGGGGG